MADKSHKSAWAFVVAALRVILFIICILALLTSTIFLWLWTLLDVYFDFSMVPNLQMTYIYIIYAQLICVSIVASFGVYGAYSGRPKYLRLFALLTFIFAALFFLVNTTQLVATDQSNVKDKYLERLEDYAKDYQFDLLPNQEPNKATETWDRVQTKLGCCGVHGWDDWKHVNQSKLTGESHRLPKSCCVKLPRSVRGVCTSNSPDIHEDGCEQALEDFSPMSHSSISEIIQELLFSLALAAIALVVANHRDSRDIVRRPSKCQNVEASTV